MTEVFSDKVKKRLEEHKKIILQTVQSVRGDKKRLKKTIQKLSHKAIPDLEKHYLRGLYKSELYVALAKNGIKFTRVPKRKALLINNRTGEMKIGE